MANWSTWSNNSFRVNIVRSVTVGPKCIFVFFKPLCEASSRLPYVRLVVILVIVIKTSQLT